MRKFPHPFFVGIGSSIFNNLNFHGKFNQPSSFASRAGGVRASRRGDLLLRRGAGQRGDRAHAPRRPAARSDDQEVSGVPQHYTKRRQALRFLHQSSYIRAI